MIVLLLLIAIFIIFINRDNFTLVSGYTLQTPGYGPEVYPYPVESLLVSSAKKISLNAKQQDDFVKYMQSDPKIATFMSDKVLNLEQLSNLYCTNFKESNKTLINCDSGLSNDLEKAYYIDNKLDYFTYNAIWTALSNRYKVITDKL